MPEVSAPVVEEPTSALLQEVRQLLSRGWYLRAYRLAVQAGPLHRWRGAAARVLAGRLAMQLGAPRLGFWHHLRAWREEPDHAEAAYYYARALLERQGLLRTWYFLRRLGELPDAPPPLRADWLALHAAVLGRLRDFDAAEDWLSRAEALAPERPWLWIERANLWELEDRYDDALAAARQALRLHPWYRPGVQAAAYLLQLQGRDGEALELLQEADQRLESSLVTVQLALLQTELGHYRDAQRSYERAWELSPLRDRDMSRWLLARRADAAYYVGDWATAAQRAREAGENDPFYRELASRLEQTSPPAPRVFLPVGFVRQHHQTCVPATLAALSRYWGMPAAHLEIAAAICYDGTPAHSERHWAESHGWYAREFTVTRDSACQLLDRGIPFTLTVSGPTFAHLQAVIGYDRCRDTLLVRDPYQRYFLEYAVEPFLRGLAASGPRGLALVPAERAALLADLELPDASLYDLFYRLMQALQEHRREEACALKEQLQRQAPDHRLTWQARRSLACYDANPTELLAAIEGLLRLYPEDASLQLARLSCLRELARREERLQLLAAQCARPDSDPVFWQQYAQELAADARCHPQAVRLLQRYLRQRPEDGRSYAALADLLWSQRRFADALELYRWAACLEDKDEHLARSYFSAARYLRQTAEALAFLQARFRRWGARSSQPARTLCDALLQLGDVLQAGQVLDQALQQRPEDGELLVYAAEFWTSHGAAVRGAELLAAAERRCRRATWLRAAAHLALFRGELTQALSLWQQFLESEPLALEAHQAVTQLLAETQGRAAALEHLRRACDRFPYHYQLHVLWAQWLREEGPAAAEPVVRRILEAHPIDAWAHRERALILLDQQQRDQAWAELESARALEPTNPSYFTVLAYWYQTAGQVPLMQEALRQAIRLSVDNRFAIAELIASCDSYAERRAALEFVKEELVRQVVFGEGLLAFREQAQGTLSAEELLQTLQEGLAARPDLWHAWSAVIRQLTDMQRYEEARALAQQAVARFPLFPVLWLDLAGVFRAKNDPAGEEEALRRAYEINPSWGLAVRQLADCCRRQGRLTEARALLEEALRRTPLDASLHGALAEVLWQQGERLLALEKVQQALRLEPGYDWAWGALRSWSQELRRPQIARDFARELCRTRGGEARSWLIYARLLRDQAEDLAECQEALERALALNPRLTEAYDLKAELLARVGRWEEAEAACQAPIWGERPPLILRGRAAWLRAQQGHLAQAIAQMRSLVAEDPGYYWGWEQLANWYRTQGQTAEYLEAARQLVQLAPHYEVPYGYLGDALSRAGERAAAKQAYRQALALCPTYLFALHALFDLAWEDNDLEEAIRLHDLLVAAGAPLADVLARRVQRAVLQQDRQTLRQTLAELCRQTDADDWPLDTALRALRQAGELAEAEQVLTAALDTPPVHPAVAQHWVACWTERRAWSQARRLDKGLQQGILGGKELIMYLEALKENNQLYVLRRCLRRYRPYLVRDTALWAEVGRLLVHWGWLRSACRWLADYPTRADVAPWMLANLVLALHGLGRSAAARQASQRALALKEDYTSPYHRTWLAWEAALAGDPAAPARLAVLSTEELDNTHLLIWELTHILCQVQQTPVVQRRQQAPAWRQQLIRHTQTRYPADHLPALRQAWRRSLRRLSALGLGGRFRLWAWRQRLIPSLCPQTKKDVSQK